MTNFFTPIAQLFNRNNEKTVKTVTNSGITFTSMPELPVPDDEVIRLKLDEYAYVEAGKNNGDPSALKTNLNHIVSGRLLDERVARQQHDKTIDRLKQQREDIRAAKTEPQGKLTHLREHQIPDAQQKIRKKELAIAEIDHQAEELVHQSGYSTFRLWLYILVWVGLTGFIYIFYSSAIYAAFFRDIQTELTQLEATSDDISQLFNTTFSSAALKSGLPGVYIAPFFFMGFAIWISIRERKLKEALKKGNVSFINKIHPLIAMLAALAADLIIAYRVETETQAFKIMNGLASPESVYTSLMFWGVFILGFGGYMAWKSIYEAIIDEHALGNVRKLKYFFKDQLERELILLEKDLLELQQGATTVEQDLVRINHELNKIDVLLERAYRGLGDLNHSMDAFYKGWTRFINGHPEKDILVPACQDIYDQYRQAFQSWQPVRHDHLLFN